MGKQKGQQQQARHRKAVSKTAPNKKKGAAARGDRFGGYGEKRLTADEIKELSVLCGIRTLCGRRGPKGKDADGNEVLLTDEQRQATNVFRLVRESAVEGVRQFVRFIPIYLDYVKRHTVDVEMVDVILRDRFGCHIAGIQDDDLFTDPSVHKRKVKESAV